jgi:Ca2+-binding RTX toxin-like protein
VDLRLEHEALGVHQDVALTALYLLGTIVTALFSAHRGTLHRLAVHHARAGLRISLQAHSQAFSETDERDKLAGEAGEDKVESLGSAVDLWGGFGSDVMYGGPGDDFLAGSTVNEAAHDKSNDVLHGGPGTDSVNGGWGDDVLYGGDGGDKMLYGGKGEDILYGEDGNDFIDASLDGQRDKLYCGKGRDHYFATKIDYVSNSCEVNERKRAEPVPPGPLPL